MNKQKLQELGFMERLSIKTPSGGDASEAYFFDENWNYTTKENAVHIIIQEYKDGIMINENFLEKNVSTQTPTKCKM